MASINKAALRNRVLEHLNVIAAGQTPATADQTLVEEAIDAAHSRLSRFNAVPFPTSAIPEWAQKDLRNTVAYDVCAAFGVSPERKAELKAEANQAEYNLKRQKSGNKHPLTKRRLFF